MCSADWLLIFSFPICRHNNKCMCTDTEQWNILPVLPKLCGPTRKTLKILSTASYLPSTEELSTTAIWIIPGEWSPLPRSSHLMSGLPCSLPPLY
ncbi:hypothetical protein DPMN_121154 [Dreissena polymorpha]|uniref:Uncharacterized protein n=1 Tax=Dreissena polymorpha TaxID=45954 RepID=A0A9D4GPZ4_DREPO|nr:hypothetical protein DPMN_121154 [Dreissena polymorpha]